MSAVQRAILKARRRTLIDRALRLGGWGMLVGTALGLALLVADRTLPLGFTPPVWLYIAFVTASTLLGVIRAAATLPGAFEFARRLDRSLHLKDRIATAHVLSARPPRVDGDFAALVTRDAEKLAHSLDARSAARIRITGVWGGAMALGAALVAGVLYLPPLTRTHAEAAVETIAHTEEASQERETLRAEIDRIIDEVRQEAVGDPRADERLEALEQLRNQLVVAESGEQREHAAVHEETAAQVSELAEQLAEQARQDAIAAEELAERFRTLETPDAPMDAAEFQEALRRGDFGRAAESLEDLLRRRESLTPRQQRELADHLRELGKEVDRAGEADRRELEERREQLEQALRDQGIDEAALQELMEALHDEDAPREEVDRRLREEISDEELAQELARELERLRDRQRVEDQVQEDAQSVSDSLRDAAHEMETGEAPSPSEARDEGAEPTDEPTIAPEEREQRDAQREPGSQQPPQGEPQGREGNQPGEQGGNEQQEGGEQRGEQPAESQEGGQESSGREQGSQEQGGQEQGEPQGAAQGEGEGQQRQRDDAKEQGNAPEPGGEPQGDATSQGDGEQEGERTQGAPEDSPGRAPGSATGDLSDEAAEESPKRGDALRDIERRRQVAERRRQVGERLREESRRLADGRPQPAESENESHSGDAAGSDGPRSPVEGERTRYAPDDIEDVDARSTDEVEPGQVIAEWLSEEPRDLEPGAPRGGEAQQRVRQAQQIAERAVNEQAVPARYHGAIRRYFNRLSEAVERAAESRQSEEK